MSGGTLTAGNTSARTDKQRAPNKDINSSKLGIAIASKTKWNSERKSFSSLRERKSSTEMSESYM